MTNVEDLQKSAGPSARPFRVAMASLIGTAVEWYDYFIFMAVVYGPLGALFAELFPPEVRYSGASLGYQIGSILGGGLAPPSRAPCT